MLINAHNIHYDKNKKISLKYPQRFVLLSFRKNFLGTQNEFELTMVNGASTLRRRYIYVSSTLKRRYIYVMCLPGPNWKEIYKALYWSDRKYYVKSMYNI